MPFAARRSRDGVRRRRAEDGRAAAAAAEPSKRALHGSVVAPCQNKALRDRWGFCRPATVDDSTRMGRMPKRDDVKQLWCRESPSCRSCERSRPEKGSNRVRTPSLAPLLQMLRRQAHLPHDRASGRPDTQKAKALTSQRPGQSTPKSHAQREEAMRGPRGREVRLRRSRALAVREPAHVRQSAFCVR